jgi:hypothetical protein
MERESGASTASVCDVIVLDESLAAAVAKRRPIIHRTAPRRGFAQQNVRLHNRTRGRLRKNSVSSTAAGTG